MQGTGKIACVGGGVVHQLGDFFDIIYFDDAMVSQPQRDRARHECDCGEVLAKPIVQFLAKSLLFAITDLENVALEPFAPVDLSLQFYICGAQRFGPLLHEFFQ